MDTQICECCGFAKSFVDYEWQANRPAPRKKCKTCRYLERDVEKENARQRKYKARWYAERKDVIRQQWERCMYGASKEDLGATHCAICGSVEKLCIDHCHKTTEIRGILCTKCNIGLGMFRDNPSFLMEAAKYLIDGPHFQLVK